MYNKVTFAIATFLFSVILQAQDMQSPLKVGDPAPGLRVYKWLKGDSVSAFDPGKIYVIEFGATWCVPCARAIPKLSAIAKSYKNDVHVLSLFVMEKGGVLNTFGEPPYVETVERYVARRKDSIHYTVGMDSPERTLVNDWISRTGISGIPVVVVVDKQGKIAWMGNHVSEVKSIIDKIRANQLTYPAAGSVDEPWSEFDYRKVLLVDGNGGPDTAFMFRSMLVRYDGKMQAPRQVSIDAYEWAKGHPEYAHYRNKLQLIGRSVEELYYLAYSDTLPNVFRHRHVITNDYPDTTRLPHLKSSYGKYWHKVVLEVKDTTIFYWSNKSSEYKFSYSLRVPEGAGSAAGLQRALRNDLNTYFGYEVSVETRVMPYWKLSIRDKKLVTSRLVSRDQNGQYQYAYKEGLYTIRHGDVRDIILRLAYDYGFGIFDYGRLPKHEQGAFIDKTGIKEKIDFTFDENKSFEGIRKHLAEIGLDLSRDYKPMKVVVIWDE